MKAFLALIIFGITLIIGTLNEDNTMSTGSQDGLVEATYDGYEDGFYFFSDENNKAISLTDDDQLPADRNELQEGSTIGEKFKIIYPKNRFNKGISFTNFENVSRVASN